ncbi:MAG: phosphoribosylanthranilate isomerase [Planctomycetota bacterium]
MSARTRIKICGVRDAPSALAAVEAGADALGFVFVGASPRAIDPEEAYGIACFLPPMVTKVGLFVNPKPEGVFETGEIFPFDIVQLHGQEPEMRVRACRDVGAPILKAIKFEAATIEDELERWSLVDEIDGLLIDGSTGGTGETFDWHALAAVRDKSAHPLILAGGLTPENVGEAIDIVRPYAVDVSSGVESSPGQKDPQRIAAFCRAVRDADARQEKH